MHSKDTPVHSSHMHGVQSLAFVHKPLSLHYLVTSSMQIRGTCRERLGNLHAEMSGATVSLYEFTIDQPDTAMRPDRAHLQFTEGLACN